MKKYAKLEPPKLKGYASTLEGYKEYVESYYYYRTVVSSYKTRWAREVHLSSEAGKVNKPAMVAPTTEVLEKRKARRRQKRERRRERQRADELKKKVSEAKAVSYITASNLKIAKSLYAEKRIIGKSADDGWTTVVSRSAKKAFKKVQKQPTFRPGLGYTKKGTTGYKVKDNVTAKPPQKLESQVTLGTIVKVNSKGPSSVPNPDYLTWQGRVRSGYATVRTSPEYWLSRPNLQLSDKGVEELKKIEEDLVRYYNKYNGLGSHQRQGLNLEQYMDQTSFFTRNPWFPKMLRPARNSTLDPGAA